MHLTIYLGIAVVATMLVAWPYREYDAKTQG